MTAETIFALASGAGRAGIAIIRISGPGAGPALAAITGGKAGASPEPRRATAVKLSDPETLVAIDDGLALWFPAPDSFTGEDVAELHVHGGPAVIMGALEALGAMPGLRTAEPGEFTRRAFENGKMDLTAAEGLADLVEAETSAQRRQALKQLRGDLGRFYESWRERLLGALAHIEAGIDFSDEDLPGGPGGVEAAAAEEVGKLVGEIAAHLKDNRRGERLRSGLLITIIGPPNAGKSSLLNLLARRDAAIVAETAGTTRDVIEVHLDLGGYPVIVADTAGLRDVGDGGDGGDDVEAEGIRRAKGKAREADLRLAVFDGQTWPETDAHTAGLVDADTLAVINKSDLGPPAPPLEVGGRPALAISALTGDGIETFLAAAAERVAGLMETAPSSVIGPALTRARHREALEECRAALERFLAAADNDKGSGKTPELAAEDLRLAARALGRITGRVDVEDVLDAIFRDFCIGK
ncbi:MAG: tRNA uridine-5-carboxymethylaminomethyl(34) synthesis GTPase MnmE [Rhodospirillaceae bacterium]|nr:tRNA uridine-5-carboxymethylaminomethyl(34) synthesis GTPase MnmE [Rhodospirillaceae bacterium]